MSGREWFRSAGWTPLDRDEFARRLARARADNRPQYLRIKGLALDEAGLTDAARELWMLVTQMGGDQITEACRAASLEHLADSYADSDPDQAIGLLRRLVTEHPEAPVSSGLQQVKLARLLIQSGTEDTLSEAESHLEAWPYEEETFPSHQFSWCLASIELALVRGNGDDAAVLARLALQLLETEAPIERHPGLGKAFTGNETVAELRRLAARITRDHVAEP